MAERTDPPAPAATVAPAESAAARRAKDTFAGFVGGAVQVLVGQPFDLVKVRMQTGQFSSVTEAFFQTLKTEGPTAFYRGTTAPLVGVGVCVSVQFWAFHEAKRQITARTGQALTFPQVYAAGAFAGLANTFVSSPVEQVRILMQTQRNAQYAGPFAAGRQILQAQGLRGLYRGFAVTALREAQAYGTWFLAFEWLVAQQTRRGVRREDIPAWQLAVFGAAAGEALWLASYPLDVVKSQVQSDAFGPAARYRGAVDAARQTWAAHGLRGFFTGLTPTLLRALPASACTFASVELTLRALG